MMCTQIAKIGIYLVFLGLSISAFGQSQDPLVGTWNVSVTSPNTTPSVAVQTFNTGGTTIEYDTAGTNPAASPGESIVLGSWQKATDGSYDVKEENYIYDSSANLKYAAITVFKISIDPTKNHYSGGGVVHFNFCSVTQCPGPLFASAPITFSGTRF